MLQLMFFFMQIVGLTASIGIEKASTIDKAVASVVDIMANMDVNSITAVSYTHLTLPTTRMV